MSEMTILENAIHKSTSKEPKMDGNGILRSNYLNGHQMLSYPDVLSFTSQKLLHLIERTDADHVAGLALGGCALAAGVCTLSTMSSRPLRNLSIRQTPKGYGSGGICSYDIEKNARLFIVDDVISTGTSALKAINSVTQFGLNVTGVAAIVRRGSEGVKAIEDRGIAVYTLIDLSRVISTQNQPDSKGIPA